MMQNIKQKQLFLLCIANVTSLTFCTSTLKSLSLSSLCSVLPQPASFFNVTTKAGNDYILTGIHIELEIPPTTLPWKRASELRQAMRATAGADLMGVTPR